tara:strand:- start:391 stop:663 length:273 start_codon:yes stop_codon:yes gene_type:complete
MPKLALFILKFVLKLSPFLKFVDEDLYPLPLENFPFPENLGDCLLIITVFFPWLFTLSKFLNDFFEPPEIVNFCFFVFHYSSLNLYKLCF